MMVKTKTFGEYTFACTIEGEVDMELSDLKGVGPVAVERLNDAGVDSIDDLAQSDAEHIADNSGMSESKAEKLVKRAKEEGVIIQTGDDVVDEYESKRHIPTGMDEIDNALDGGWREGDVIAVGGASGSGKTQISFHSAVRAVEETGEPVVYIETEHGRYSPKRLRQFVRTDEGHDPEEIQSKIYRIKAYDLEQQELAYEKVAKELDTASLIIVDSFSANFRGAEEFDDRSGLNDRASVTRNHLAGIRNAAEQLECPALVTAQVYANPSMYSADEAIYGGSVFYHTINFLLYLKDGQGSFTEGTILNHYELPEVEFQINIGEERLEAMKEV